MEQFYASSRAVHDRVRVFGPYMSRQGLRAAQDARRRRDDRRRLAVRGRPDPEFWEAHWRGDEEPALAHARRTEELFPKLWLPGGWAGQYGHYRAS